MTNIAVGIEIVQDPQRTVSVSIWKAKSLETYFVTESIFQ